MGWFSTPVQRDKATSSSSEGKEHFIISFVVVQTPVMIQKKDH